MNDITKTENGKKFNFDFNNRYDPDEETHIINIDGKRIGIIVNAYYDDDGTQIIDVLEKIDGSSSRRIAFIADGQETKIYPNNI